IWLEVVETWHWYVHAVFKVARQQTCCVDEALRSADRALMSVFPYIGTMMMTMTTNRRHPALPLHSAQFFRATFEL
ncbi:hypothetical protein P692DRAFT_20721460, partial [Suillus brevipes Sb2]